VTSGNDEGPTYAVASYVVRPTGYDDLVHPDKHHWCVRVEDAGDGWAIRRDQACLNFRNEWEHEPPPESRDQAFLRRCRYNEHAALLRTRRVIDRLEFNGLTFAEFVTQVRAALAEELRAESADRPSSEPDGPRGAGGPTVT
jgi:hypothetical protein